MSRESAALFADLMGLSFVHWGVSSMDEILQTDLAQFPDPTEEEGLAIIINNADAPPEWVEKVRALGLKATPNVQMFMGEATLDFPFAAIKPMETQLQLRILGPERLTGIKSVLSLAWPASDHDPSQPQVEYLFYTADKAWKVLRGV